MDRDKVLVVDDEAYIRLLVKSILGRDYDVLEAENGEEAIEIARVEKPALVLMDIMMPKMDGVGACSLLKANADTAAIPVVMMSARGDTLDQDYAREMGADGYVTKPFMSRELLDMVGKMVNR
jgi:two-component system alkaline phosphatase synthesis response regulator PhoP